MSSKLNPVLIVPPYEEVETRVPKLPYKLLPGRIALMQHPLKASASGILLAAGTNRAVWVCEKCGEATLREGLRCENCGSFERTECRKSVGSTDGHHLEPDLCVVADSQAESLKQGEVLIVQPESGARIPAPKEGWDGWDKRDLRLLGLPGMPWEDRILARYTENGVTPMPGYSLVERELRSLGSLAIKEAYEPYGTALSGEGYGERVVFEMCQFWTFSGLPKSWALVKSQASVKAFSRAG